MSQAILKPIFPYSMNSILSKVRHSNTLFLTINLHFLVVLLVLWLGSHVGRGGGGQLQCRSESAQYSEKQQSPCEEDGVGGLEFEKNKCWKNNKVHT